MSGAIPAPGADWQLAFLTKLQRLFAEGDFTATYKFALLIALSDLAVERGADDGSALELSTRHIGDRFVQLYWRHALPYGGEGEGHAGILAQNLGPRAAVLTSISAFRVASGAATLAQARASAAYAALVSKVSAVVSAQPLTYLQNFGGTTDAFLYERPTRGMVRLKPNVAYCLRRFHPLVQQLARSHWVDHIKSNRRNQDILGQGTDLEEFLFGISRQSLSLIGAGLRKLDGSVCFYCRQTLQEADVDHFVPFALYPRDLSHNFVLAHPQCNRSKSDTLAGRMHLERWLERLATVSSQLSEIGSLVGVPADSQVLHRVAAWGYANAHAVGARAWVKPASYETVQREHLDLFQLV